MGQSRNPLPAVTLISEDALHKSVASLLSTIIAEQGTLSTQGVWWCSIEHRNAKSSREGAFRKKRGVIAGIPDIVIGYDQRAYWIELKTAEGIVSKVQKAFHNVLTSSGHVIKVCRSIEDVRTFINDHHIPTQRIAGLC
ncbi:VRR-NUC domain-containing protein [Aristophania vespae]|uniref:VRR-NUC domain-containing protein n=1 Tax=Aristophania vespae TaxID=2697033 RepID=UPI00235177F0|nr:VRR-NUC domain-containing protein [Aristophania vespae]UMM63112.1 hypothetical protein DM15PD_00660 [Aristophania vespae]